MNRAQPDSIVLLFPTPWTADESRLLQEVHEEFWIESIAVDLEPGENEDVSFAGTITLADGFVADAVVEAPIPELTSLSGNTIQPYAASELILLEQHESIWRVTLGNGAEESSNNARRAGKLMSTFVEAGASGAFLPALVRLHSPGTVKKLAMDLDSLENLTTLVVSAWHGDDWMVTRGLTAMGLPELETPIDAGFNAAYFRLMDLAAGMVQQGAPYPSGSQIDMGPKRYKLTEGGKGPADEQVPLSGHYGKQSLIPS